MAGVYLTVIREPLALCGDYTGAWLWAAGFKHSIYCIVPVGLYPLAPYGHQPPLNLGTT